MAETKPIDFRRRDGADLIAALTEATHALKHYVPRDDDLLERAGEWSAQIRHAERTLGETRRSWESSALELSDGQPVGESSETSNELTREAVREWFHNWPRIIDDLLRYNEGNELGLARDLVVAGILPEKGSINKVRALIDDMDERRIPDRSDWSVPELDEWSLDDPHTVNVRTDWKTGRR